jgi:hypothetical protein
VSVRWGTSGHGLDLLHAPDFLGVETLHTVSQFVFPAFEQPDDLVSLKHLSLGRMGKECLEGMARISRKRWRRGTALRTPDPQFRSVHQSISCATHFLRLTTERG